MSGPNCDSGGNGRRLVLNKDTLVPISLVSGVAVMLFSLASTFVWLKTSLYGIDVKITSVENKLGEIMRNNVAQQDVRNWIKVFKAQNPQVNVPDF